MHVDTGPSAPKRLKFSADLAARFEAHLVGLYLQAPAVRQMLIAGVHAEMGSRSIAELEAERDEVLLSCSRPVAAWRMT